LFNVDVALMKDVAITEHVTSHSGAQVFKIFNHPNFDQPVADLANPQFGFATSTVGPPTSFLGSFVGAGVSAALRSRFSRAIPLETMYPG
jgi:hypothetical protein